jgi:hypothetical protein
MCIRKLFSLWANAQAVVIRVAAMLYALGRAFVPAVKRDFPSWAVDAKAAVGALATLLFGGLPTLLLGWLTGTVERVPQASTALGANHYFHLLLLWDGGWRSLPYWVFASLAGVALSVGEALWCKWNGKPLGEMMNLPRYFVKTFALKFAISAALFGVGIVCPDPLHPSVAGVTLLLFTLVVGFQLLYVLEGTSPRHAQPASKGLFEWLKVR